MYKPLTYSLWNSSGKFVLTHTHARTHMVDFFYDLKINVSETWMVLFTFPKKKNRSGS